MSTFYGVIRIVTECYGDFIGISEVEAESKPESSVEVSAKADVFVDWFDSLEDAEMFAREYVESRWCKI